MFGEGINHAALAQEFKENVFNWPADGLCPLPHRVHGDGDETWR